MTTPGLKLPSARWAADEARPVTEPELFPALAGSGAARHSTLDRVTGNHASSDAWHMTTTRTRAHPPICP